MHAFYPELWPELDGRLATVPEPFDLFVTLPEGQDVLQARVRQDRPEARVLACPNRGRDVGPFLRVLPDLLAGDYLAVCKLHTKQGGTEGDTWRHLALEGLLGGPELVREVVHAFETQPELALVGPDLFNLDGPTFTGLNAAPLARLLREVRPDARTPPAWGFFAGTMFWFRPSALADLARLDPDLHLQGDDALNDGQAAHAVERLVGLLAAVDGRVVGLTDVSGETAPTSVELAPAPGRVSHQELADVLPRRAAELAMRRPGLLARRRRWRAPEGADLGVNLIGPLEAQHGLGVSARGLLKALEDAGVPVNATAWRPGFDRVRMRELPLPQGPEQPINLVALNFDLLHTASLLDVAPLDLRIGPHAYNVAVVYWELQALRPEWWPTIHRFDEIWVASSFMQRAFEAGSAVKVRVVRPALGFPPPRGGARARFGLPPDRFVFMYSADFGSSARRKNPLGYWRAYAEAFRPEEEAFCLLKLHYADPADPLMAELEAIAAGRPDMAVMTRSLSEAELSELYASIDGYVSPHRSEGLGQTLLEAMQAGKPVAAVRYGGVTDFVDPETAVVIAHDLVEVGPGAEPYPAGAVWADPRPASLRAAMRTLFEDREGSARRVAAARARVDALFGAAAAAAAMEGAVAEIWRAAGGGRTARA